MAVIALGEAPQIHAARKPADAVAVVYPDAMLTWPEFQRRVSRRARWLRNYGVTQDDMVVIALSNSSLFQEVAFAIWNAGAVPTVVSAQLPAQEFQSIVDLVQPKFVIGRPNAAVRAPWLDAYASTEAFDDTPLPSGVSTYWKAMSSGGSTGTPKIIVDHLPADVDLDRPHAATTMQIGPDDVVLVPGPLHHNTPFIFTTQSLAIGCKVVGMDRFDAEEALRLIAEHKVTWVSLVPTMMHRIWNLPQDVRDRYDLSSLRMVWHMAAACPAWLKEAWIGWLGAERIWELYGGTERNGATIIRGDEWLRKRGSVGRVAGDKSLKVFREDGSECAIGEVGELYFRAPDPTATASHYIGAESRRRADGWESIGDLGHVDEEGFVFLADRRTDLILRGGANIFPAEVEAALDAHELIGSSIVVGLPCEEMGQRVHAIVEVRDGKVPDIDAINAFLLSRLAKYKLPESYEFVAHPLRDDAGKARRSALRDERAAWMAEGRAFRHKVGEDVLV